MRETDRQTDRQTDRDRGRGTKQRTNGPPVQCCIEVRSTRSYPQRKREEQERGQVSKETSPLLPIASSFVEC